MCSCIVENVSLWVDLVLYKGFLCTCTFALLCLFNLIPSIKTYRLVYYSFVVHKSSGGGLDVTSKLHHVPFERILRSLHGDKLSSDYLLFCIVHVSHCVFELKRLEAARGNR